MFLFGGSGNNNNARNWETIYILNCDTCEWEKVCPNDALGTNTPEPRDSHACVRIGNNMYIFGGSNGENPLNDMFAFNLVSKTWIKIDATGEIPSAREGHSGVALSDRYFFIFGGWDGKNIFQNCYLFDFITKKWKMIEYTPGTEPLPRESHSCALLNDCIYIFGGQGTSIKKKNTYYNDLFRLKINIDKSLERVTGVWTKMTSKNGLYPSPRTSHSISPYKDRFLIVIGGEGYSTNNEVMDPEEIISEANENGLKEVEETNNEESDDDEHAPCFPKADIWIYDIEDSTWNVLDIKNSELFLPRFTHSCTVYKDSLIIFGGLKDLKNSIDDLMVLMLEDSETKKPIHLCSCCKKMLDSEPTDEVHPLSTGKIGFELKKVDTSFDEMETDLLAEYPTNSKPFISISYLPDVSNIIKWPFACFGLLIDSAMLINSKQIHIRWENKFRYSYTPNRVVLKDLTSIQSFLVFEFDGEDSNNISVEPTSENIFKEEQTTVFYKNLKIAGLRLGESIFYVKKRGSLIELYYLSTSLKNNPDLNDFIVFSCCWDVETQQKWSQSFPQFKKSILDNVSHVLSEEEILQLPSKNTFFVLNLRKTLLKKKTIFELYSKKDDICLNMPKILENTKNSKLNSVTWSLRTYLEHFFIVPPKEDFEIYLNKGKIGFNQCFSTLHEGQSFENPEILTAFSKNTKFFLDIDSFDKKKANNTIENEEKKTEPGQNLVEELKNEEKEKTLEIVKSSEAPHRGHSGILIYQNNRLLHRFDEITTLPQVFGFIELDSSITLDFSKSVKKNIFFFF